MTLVAFAVVMFCISPNVNGLKKCPHRRLDRHHAERRGRRKADRQGHLAHQRLAGESSGRHTQSPGTHGHARSCSIQSGRRTEVTLTLRACDTKGGGDITLTFGPPATPSNYILKHRLPPPRRGRDGTSWARHFHLEFPRRRGRRPNDGWGTSVQRDTPGRPAPGGPDPPEAASRPLRATRANSWPGVTGTP